MISAHDGTRVVLRRLRTGLLLLWAVAVVGVLGFRVLEGYSWLDAAYMTVITLTTVGYREVEPLSPVGKMFTMILLVSGLGVTFYTAVLVVQNVLEGEFVKYLGRRRMERRIAALSGHFIVCGFGRIGEVICRELATKPVPFVVVERDPRAIEDAEGRQYLTVGGDAMTEETLRAAGIDRARALFAALGTDADNVFITLMAREENPSLQVIARAENERGERTLRHAGADRAVSPYTIGAHRMAQAALRPAVVDIIDLATHSESLELQMEDVPVTAGSPLAARTLAETDIAGRFGVIVAALKRSTGGMAFNPPPQTRLEPGDVLVVLGETARVRALETALGIATDAEAEAPPPAR